MWWIRCDAVFLASTSYFLGKWHSPLFPTVFAFSCISSAWAWASEGMKSTADLHQWVLLPWPFSNSKGSHKYLKWVCYKYSTSNLHWIDVPEHTTLFPQKVIWKVDINPDTMLLCLLCFISRKLGKAIELEAIKPTYQVLNVQEKKRKSVSPNLSLLFLFKARFLCLAQKGKGDLNVVPGFRNLS